VTPQVASLDFDVAGQCAVHNIVDTRSPVVAVSA
jgi:hypothetical protein